MTCCISFSSNTTWNLYNFRGNLIRRLLDAGCCVIIISPRDSYYEKFISLGCDVIDIQMDNKGNNPVKDLQTYFAYKGVYKKMQPDVALHYTVKPNIYGTLAAKSLGIPVINTISGLGTAFLEESWLTRVVESLYKISQQWPHDVFFQNPDDYKVFEERGLIDNGKMHIVPGSGVDLEHFSPRPSPGGSSVCFLMCGRLLLDKGVKEYVLAAQQLKSEFPDTVFQLLGPLGVSNRSAVMQDDIDTWQDSGVIEYLGETDDVRPMVESADCIVLPSYREGTPKTLLEAAAMSKPIIATDVPGCREVVIDNVSGYLCKARDVDDLMQSMRRFIELSDGERERMGIAGRKMVETKFDERKVIDRYMQAINEVMSES